MSSEIEKGNGGLKKAAGVNISPEYTHILGEVAELLETARRSAERAVNSVLTQTYWEIGRRIGEIESAQPASSG